MIHSDFLRASILLRVKLDFGSENAQILQVFSLTHFQSIRAGWVFGSIHRPGRFRLFSSASRASPVCAFRPRLTTVALA
jgi:hypothetical protein